MSAAQSPLILVINLPVAQGRRRLMQAQLEAPGMPPHVFINGIEPGAMSGHARAELYDDEGAKRYSGGSLTLAEIGCAASHLAACRHVVSNRISHAVVLEDDALLGQQFPGVLERLVDMTDPHRAQVVLLSHVARYFGWRRRKVDRVHSLFHPYEAYGAHAYLITLAGAQAMLAAFPRVRVLADDWSYFRKSQTVDLLALVPYAVGTSPFASESHLRDGRTAREREGSKSTHAFRHWLRRYLWQKLVFQIVVKPALRLHRAEQTW